MSSPRHNRFRLLALLLLVVPLTTALSIHRSSSSSPSALFARASSDECPADDYSTCSASLPDNFCCPSDSTCLVLAGNTTALCCPNDDCPRLATIPCDLSVQDVSKNPKAQIMTTELDGELPSCGKDACCPYGYSCEKCGVDGSEVDCCVKNEDQDEKPGETTTKSADDDKTKTTTTEGGTATTATATGTPAATTTTDSAGTLPTSGTSTSDDDDDDDEGSNRKKQTTSVGLIVGVFGGSIAALALLGVMVFVYFRKHAADDDSVATKLFHKLQEFRGIIYNDDDDNKKRYDDSDDDEDDRMAAKARDEGLGGGGGGGDSYFQKNGHATAAAAARQVSVSEKSKIQRGNSNYSNSNSNSTSTTSGSGWKGKRDTQSTARSKKRGRYSGYSYESGGSDNDGGSEFGGGSTANTVHVATAVRYHAPEAVSLHPQYPSRLPLPTHAAVHYPTGAWGAAWARGPGLPPPNQPPPPPQQQQQKQQQQQQQHVPEVRITVPQPTLASPLHSNPPSAGLGAQWVRSGSPAGSARGGGSSSSASSGGEDYEDYDDDDDQEWPPAASGGRQFIPYRKGSLAGSLYG